MFLRHSGRSSPGSGTVSFSNNQVGLFLAAAFSEHSVIHKFESSDYNSLDPMFSIVGAIKDIMSQNKVNQKLKTSYRC